MTNELTWTTEVSPTSSGDYVCHRSQKFDFGVSDDKGRAVGVVAYIVEYQGKIVMSTQAQRGGTKFGAIANGTTVATVDEGKALAVKKVAAARKRAIKAWSK
jgi:hypothetical protein